MRNVWIRTQIAVITSRRATKCVVAVGEGVKATENKIHWPNWSAWNRCRTYRGICWSWSMVKRTWIFLYMYYLSMHLYGMKAYCIMLSHEFSLNVKNEFWRIRIPRPWLIRVSSLFSFMCFKSVWLRLDVGFFFFLVMTILVAVAKVKITVLLVYILFYSYISMRPVRKDSLRRINQNSTLLPIDRKLENKHLIFFLKTPLSKHLQSLVSRWCERRIHGRRNLKTPTS